MKIYTLAFLLLFQGPFTSSIRDNQQKCNKNKLGPVNIVFTSTNGGQTWQDISEGLPGNWQGGDFFANESGLHVTVGKYICHSKPNSPAPFWKKEIFTDKHSSNTPRKNGIFETASGTLIIGSYNGLYKSTNSGKTWKQVHAGGWVKKLVEKNGVLVATSQGGILRSTDEGETWDRVISEGGVGIAIECIEGGFAAITYNTMSKTRRVRTSYDGGKTWQPIDAGLPASLNIASILQVGQYFFCGHPAGIFRSSDKGKTWKLLLPSIKDKVFNLFVSGNVIYAIPGFAGC
jgi:photosystem II stability/assembly factor-like uncharacterized protein